MTGTEPFWPDNARLAVSFSLMFEGGGQPISGAGGVIPDPIEKGLLDLLNSKRDGHTKPILRGGAANASQFGLSGNLWTRDVELARKVARDLYTPAVCSSTASLLLTLAFP